MNSLKKNMILALTFITLCFSSLVFSYSELKKKTTPIDDPVSSAAHNTEGEVPIIIYNSHPDEKYSFGKTVTDIGMVINNNLKKEGLYSSFVEVSIPESYSMAYANSRKILTSSSQNYDESILLDIHRQASEDSKTNNRSILIVLSKDSPNYATSKDFADSLVKEIKILGDVKVDTYIYNNGINYFNQDLAKNSLLIEIGSQKSSNEDVNACINALVSALKKVNLLHGNSQ